MRQFDLILLFSPVVIEVKKSEYIQKDALHEIAYKVGIQCRHNATLSSAWAGRFAEDADIADIWIMSMSQLCFFSRPADY